MIHSTESGIMWEDPPTAGGTIPTGILDSVRITMHTELEDEQGHRLRLTTVISWKGGIFVVTDCLMHILGMDLRLD